MVVEYKCDFCNFSTGVLGKYNRHLECKKHLHNVSMAGKPSYTYHCQACCYGTDCSTAWSMHCRSKKHIARAAPSVHACECGRYFHSARARTFHKKKCDWESPSSPPPSSPPSPPPPQPIQMMPTICLPISEPSRTDPFGMENALLKSRMKDMDDSLTRYRDMNDRLSKTIKTMQEWTADGGLKCNICETMNTGLEVYEDQYGKQMICNKCCTRMTGFASIRIEKIMVEFLQVHYEVPMSVVDKRIKGEACLAYRPDVMYIDHTRAVHVECDENQHYSYTCDEKRMTDLYAEYPGKTAIWIRWNPHDYKAGNKTQGERLRQLVDTLKQVESMEFDSKIHVIYMFYDEDHPSIVQNISRSFRS